MKKAVPPLSRRLRDQPAPAVVAAGFALVAAAGVGDYLTGAEVSFSIFYLPGVAVAAWGAGRQPGLWLALLAGVLWLGGALLGGVERYSHPVIPYWNAGVRLAIFTVFALLLAELRRMSLQAEERRQTDPETGTTRPIPFFDRVEREHAGGGIYTLVYVDTGAIPLLAGDGSPEGAAGPAVAALRRVLRGGDIIARPRGRELALLLPELGRADAPGALERIRAELDALASSAGTAVALGAVTCESNVAGVNHVIQRAYQLMYSAPRVAEGAVLAYEPHAETPGLAELRMVGERGPAAAGGV